MKLITFNFRYITKYGLLLTVYVRARSPNKIATIYYRRHMKMDGKRVVPQRRYELRNLPSEDRNLVYGLALKELWEMSHKLTAYYHGNFAMAC